MVNDSNGVGNIPEINKLLVAYFSQTYSSNEEMAIAFDAYNKKYKRHARKNKLREKEFEITVKQILNNIKDNGKSI